MSEAITPVVLEAAWDPASSYFCVCVTVQGVEYRQVMETDTFVAFCARLDTGIYMDQLTFRYKAFDKRDVTIRMQRGIKEYFASLL